MQIPLGLTWCVQNIEAFIFRRLPVRFSVGVAISIRHARVRFVALATRWLALACCKRPLMPSQRLNAVACNAVIGSGSAAEYSCGVHNAYHRVHRIDSGSRIF